MKLASFELKNWVWTWSRPGPQGSGAGPLNAWTGPLVWVRVQSKMPGPGPDWTMASVAYLIRSGGHWAPTSHVDDPPEMQHPEGEDSHLCLVMCWLRLEALSWPKPALESQAKPEPC